MVHRRVISVERSRLVADCELIRAGCRADAAEARGTLLRDPHPGLPTAVLLHACTLVVDENVGDGVYPLPHDWRLEVKKDRVRMIWGDELDGGPHEHASNLTLPESFRRAEERPPDAMPT